MNLICFVTSNKKVSQGNYECIEDVPLDKYLYWLLKHEPVGVVQEWIYCFTINKEIAQAYNEALLLFDT